LNEDYTIIIKKQPKKGGHGKDTIIKRFNPEFGEITGLTVAFPASGKKGQFI
jgi:alpha-acetolactate decarboxylase